MGGSAIVLIGSESIDVLLFPSDVLWVITQRQMTLNFLENNELPESEHEYKQEH